MEARRGEWWGWKGDLNIDQRQLYRRSLPAKIEHPHRGSPSCFIRISDKRG